MRCKEFVSVSIGACCAGALAQPAGPLVVEGPRVPAVVLPANEVIAALPYDGSTGFGASAQTFESPFECYDIFVIEDFEIFEDARVTEFRSRGFGDTRDLFLTQDFIGWIYVDDGSGLPGEDEFTGELLMRSVVGVGRWDGEDFVTSFGGQCLAAGRYILVYTVRLDFADARSFLFTQSGAPTVGGGGADNAWHWNPGGCFGAGSH